MTASPQPIPKVCVVQDGARLHYAVPLALQRQGALARMYTDWYAARPTERAIATLLGPVGGSRLKRMRERVADELDARLVRSKPSLALLQLRRGKFASEIDFFAMVRRRTADWILAAGFGDANGIFGYVRNIDPAVCEAARARGLKVIVDQIIAPFEIECAEAAKQEQRFPGWSTEPPNTAADPVAEVERRTWQHADRVTCASDYVRQGLMNCGVDAGKIAVLPYPFDCRHIASIDRRGRGGPVTVGFVGKVGVRKGVPYLFELARRFDPARVRFVCVGPVYLDPKLAAEHRGSVELVGAVPRSEIAGWLDRFDVFLLPSTCEGSAGAVVEAMASGLPVLVSPNAGAPISDGVEGLLAAYDDVDAMQRHVEALIADAERRHAMGLAARRRAEQLTLDAYGRQLVELFAEGR